MNHRLVFSLSCALVVATHVALAAPIMRPVPLPEDSKQDNCIVCHGRQGQGVGIVEQWRESHHALNGVGCIDCHKAPGGRDDAYEHHGNKIVTVVTPKQCADCHQTEFDQYQKSHHASAAKILGSLDNTLGEVVEGMPAAEMGCKQCHGGVVLFQRDAQGKIVVSEDGRPQFDKATWPNTGIGRINPDGTLGSCTACHARHSFSSAQARQPENCGKCHMGPDHPQAEIYAESKHGINYRANIGKMNLDKKEWVVGRDYFSAPTCATCHMSATPNQPITHDVGDRISWTLRPAISEKIDAAALKAGKVVLPWEKRRENMQDVCQQCHQKQWIGDFYKQYDDVVNLYNDKFGRPATKIYNAVRDAGFITKDVQFDDRLEWIYYELWHHEGRRARMGASMMGPDYTQWHGMYEVAKKFYTEFIPEVKTLIADARTHGKGAQADAIEKMVSETLESKEHAWFIGKMDPAEKAARQKAMDEFKSRYAN